MSDQKALLHAHHHHVLHAPSDANSDGYEAANKHHFDTEAHQFDNRPGATALAQKIGQAMRNTGLFKQGVTTVMDFACGTGLLSRELAAEDPKLIIGVDISQGMVDQYNKVVSDHGIPSQEMSAICATLGDSKLEGMTFDVIICSTAYHHLRSIDEVTQSLVSMYLNPGGSLLVADIAHGESIFPEKFHHIVAHTEGFKEEDIRSTFEKAGLKNVTFEVIGQAKMGASGHEVELFLARGDK